MWFVNLLPNLNMYNTSVGALKFEKAYKTLTSPATTQGAVHLTVGLLPVVSGCQLWAAERIRELPLLDLRWRRWEICFGFFPKHLRENDAKVLLRMESEVNIAGGGVVGFFSPAFGIELRVTHWAKSMAWLVDLNHVNYSARQGCHIEQWPVVEYQSSYGICQGCLLGSCGILFWKRSDTSGWYRVPQATHRIVSSSSAIFHS